MHNLTVDDTDNASIYVPEEETTDSSTSSTTKLPATMQSLATRRQNLNAFLESCEVTNRVGPYKRAWIESSTRTKHNHVMRAKDAVVSVLNVIAPNDGAPLWYALQSSSLVKKELGCEQPSPAEEKYLQALAETYRNAVGWDTRRQVLSVMSDLVPLNRLKKYLPEINEYLLKVARQHKLVHGRGAPMPPVRQTRMKVDGGQLDHFPSFITSGHIIQDLPSGQRFLKLSNGDILETPNVIRMLIPERIVQQYQAYCEETQFKPFGRTTMLNILSACSASTRKSLQGLDYIAAEGAKAFDMLYTASPPRLWSFI